MRTYHHGLLHIFLISCLLVYILHHGVKLSIQSWRHMLITNVTFFKFMNKFEQALKGYINDESEDDFGSLYLESYLTISLHSIDKNATKTYTT